MPARLKDRNVQIPYGLKFKLAKTKWSPHPYSSFDTIVRQLQQHLQANPAYLAELGWTLEYDFLAQKVDEYNAAIAKSHGWTSYIMEGEGVVPHPKSIARNTPSHVANLVAGVNTLTDWLGTGGVPVAQDLAETRANTCAAGDGGKRCPKNSDGGLLKFFTVPAQKYIKKLVEKRNEMKLATSRDKDLGVCVACDCPLNLKVFTPIEVIKANLSSDAQAELVPFCWIRREITAQN